VNLGRITLSFTRWPSPCYSTAKDLPSNPTTTWDAYGKDGATAYGTFSPMQGIMQPVSPGTSRYLG
jgi:hypothetical protein